MVRAVRLVGWSMAALAVGTLLAGGYWVYSVNKIETPVYTVVRQDRPDGAIEIRDYPALVVAEVTTKGDRRAAVSAGFGPLAGYIFAKDRPPGGNQGRHQGAIAMTAPVTQTPATGADWVVRFVMPSQYTLATLPVPAGANVRLTTLPAQRRAVIRFSGRATDTSVAEQEAQLLAWMAAQGVTPAGPATYAYYNPPFYPPPLMRNEVMFEVTR